MDRSRTGRRAKRLRPAETKALARRPNSRKTGPPAGSESVVADASRGRLRNSLLHGLENLVELSLHCSNPALKCHTRSGRT